MKAAVGDRIPVHGLHVGDATRCGEVLEVKGAGGEPPYVVCWDDGHEAVFVPGSGVRRPTDPASTASVNDALVGAGKRAIVESRSPRRGLAAERPPSGR